ncbi:MAG: arylesterase [Rickettsiales bacterium]|nr:arylesterase [Rickettsiales bacterium]
MLSSLYSFFILRFLVILIVGLNFIPTKVYCNQKIALFGDSLMSGYGLEESFHLSTILEKNLKEKGFDVNVINASVSGDTTSGGLNRLKWLLEKRDIDIVILCLGANDMLRGIKPSLIKQNLNKILEILQERSITILLAGMLSQETLGNEYKNKFDSIYPELAKKFQISFLPFLLDGVALNVEFNLNDGKHPNQKGIKIISKNLEKKLIDLLDN